MNKKHISKIWYINFEIYRDSQQHKEEKHQVQKSISKRIAISKMKVYIKIDHYITNTDQKIWGEPLLILSGTDQNSNNARKRDEQNNEITLT